MASFIAIALVGAILYWVYSNVSGLLRNIAAAKRSGLPYVVARRSKSRAAASSSNLVDSH